MGCDVWDLEEMTDSPPRMHAMWGQIPNGGTLTKERKMKKYHGKTKT